MVERPRLLLIRPKVQSLAFLADCEARLGRRIDAVVSPIIDIEPIGEIPDLDGYGTVIFTSSNAVRQMSENLKGRLVATVGDATAELARSLGADATVFGETANDLLDRAEALVPPVLICRGVHARVDLQAELTARGVAATSVIVYDQVARSLTPLAVDLLSGSNPVILPLFSPRSAMLLSREPLRAPMNVIAISEAVKAAWTGASIARVAKEPNSKAVCDLVTEAL